MTAPRVVPLTADHFEQAWHLSRLSFGGDPDAAPPPPPDGPPLRDAWGVLDARGRLLAKAVLLDHEQWWGGRRVPMGGVAGVAVHPDARGTGLARRLLDVLTGAMRERGQPVSVLFPTVVGLYRRLGWEVVGTLDETRVLTRALLDVDRPDGVTVRTAEADRDAEAVHALYARWAAAGAGALTREGRPFPVRAADAFDGDVVALAESADGTPLGYAAYDRGRGYRDGSELFVRELVADRAEATAALLTSLGGWHPVAGSTRWRGPTAELQGHLPTTVPPPVQSQPWMLRVVDPAVAVAARGWAGDVDLRLVLVGAAGDGRPVRLRVQDGAGSLEPARADGPRLHERGLALLFAGAADTAGVRRRGLLDGALPGLDAALAGPPPVLLDYF